MLNSTVPRPRSTDHAGRNMPRAARQAATEALSRLGQTSAQDLGSDDDGETDSDDGEEVREEQQPATEPLPLTEYELQRQRNIAANQSVLESLGLAGKTPLGAAASSSSQRARKSPQDAAAAAAAKAAKAVSRKQPRRGVNADPDHDPDAPSDDAEDEDAEDDADGRSDASTASMTPSHRGKRRAGAADSPATVELDDAQRRRAAARFRSLRGESAGAAAAEPPPSARLTRPQLARTLTDLGLEVSEHDVSDMLSFFDSGGGGGAGGESQSHVAGLSFADFLRLVQKLPSSVLD